MDSDEARRRLAIFQEAGTGWRLEGTPETRRRWHNQKYFTWVEQQGRSLDELRAQEDPDFWIAQQQRIGEIDRQILERRS